MIGAWIAKDWRRSTCRNHTIEALLPFANLMCFFIGLVHFFPFLRFDSVWKNFIYRYICMFLNEGRDKVVYVIELWIRYTCEI
jgi:hypothetical protein